MSAWVWAEVQGNLSDTVKPCGITPCVHNDLADKMKIILCKIFWAIILGESVVDHLNWKLLRKQRKNREILGLKINGIIQLVRNKIKAINGKCKAWVFFCGSEIKSE